MTTRTKNILAMSLKEVIIKKYNDKNEFKNLNSI